MKSLKQLYNDWQASRKAFEKLQAEIPRIIGVESVRVVKQNFQLQAYDSGTSITSWPKRAPATDKAYDRGKTKDANGKLSRTRTGKNGTYKGSVFSSAKPLELQTRNLYNAVKYQRMGKKVTIGVDQGLIPYAKIQNEGGRGIPPRQYMPKDNQEANPKILKAVHAKIKYERDKVMRMFKK